MTDKLKIKIRRYQYLFQYWGSRRTPYRYFWVLPMFSISKTVHQEKFTITLAWLFWTITIKFYKQ